MALPRRIPGTPAQDLPRELIPLLREVIVPLLQDLVVYADDLVKTSRFNRGGFHGPMDHGATFTVGRTPVCIYEGGDDPAAITIETDGDSVADDFLYVSRDATGIKSGFRLPLDGPSTIHTGNPLLVYADRHQKLWAMAEVHQGDPPMEPVTISGFISVRVIIGRA